MNPDSSTKLGNQLAKILASHSIDDTSFIMAQACVLLLGYKDFDGMSFALSHSDAAFDKAKRAARKHMLNGPKAMK